MKAKRESENKGRLGLCWAGVWEGSGVCCMCKEVLRDTSEKRG